MDAEHTRLEASLYALRKSLAAEEVEAQKLGAQRAATEEQLASASVKLQVGGEHRGGSG